jgi:hypothetical protein
MVKEFPRVSMRDPLLQSSDLRAIQRILTRYIELQELTLYKIASRTEIPIAELRELLRGKFWVRREARERCDKLLKLFKLEFVKLPQGTIMTSILDK